MFKIMTLNLWCYYDWENRKDAILSLVNEQNPDCIALQEVQTNFAFSAYPQSDFIANSCGYDYRVFAPTYARDSQIDRGGKRNQRTSYGRAFISKYPIVSSEGYFLQQYPDHDEANSVLFCKVEVGGIRIDICNVHFANSDKHSDLHLNELMDICEKRQLQPILLGDFNNFDLGAYKNTRLKDYILSTDIVDYVSMPKDNGTLDYVAVPSSQYTLKDVLCSDKYVSDHRALLASIDW